MSHAAASRALDLSRRRVAAIQFLANINVDEGADEVYMGDKKVTEIRLDCLQVRNFVYDVCELIELDFLPIFLCCSLNKWRLRCTPYLD